MSSYAALWCKSHYSFLEGASSPEDLVSEAHRLGLRALALTDRNGVYGLVRGHMKAKALGLQLILGAELALDEDPPLVLLVQHRHGYAQLCRLLTQGHLRSGKGNFTLSLEEVCDRQEGLIALWSGTSVAVGAQLREAFGDRLYARVVRHFVAEDIERERRLRQCASQLELPVVAATEVLYHTESRRPLQDILTCIRHKTSLHHAGRRLRPNREHALNSVTAFSQRFEDDPAAIARTVEIADRCLFSLDELRYRYPSERLPSGVSSADWLRQLTFQGATWRYGGNPPDAVVQQLETELALIEALDYPGYFLTMWEIVELCRARGILCQGRGSAANSAVCYCLGITAIDPVKMDLLFERFISKERADPPDIDLDIEHARREEVIQWVYDKYGRSHAAMVANVVRYRTRSAIRDVGKALGLPETALAALAKLASRYDGDGAEMMRHAGLDPNAPLHAHLIQLTSDIQEVPRHLSIHPGGFLLGHEPVCDLVPIEVGRMEHRTVIQWDKDDIEALGLFKVDLLGLGALTLLHRSFDLLKTHKQIDLTLAEIPAEDAATYEMVKRADTVGVFQIESRAQMAMLPRLRPETFYDLVIEVSLVRPGPISGNMVHPYLRRRNKQEAITYPHACLKPVLAKTLGVPLFQEQVIRLAVVAADYTPGEADQLRRDMAAWKRSGHIERHRERLISRMEAKGIRPEFAERVFEQIRGFGEYGFPESHAASFALIAYATAWVKCHHPEVFACALLNAQPMGFYSAATIVEDAKRHHVTILPIDVCHSEWECTLEGDGPHAVRMGFRYVNGLGEHEGHLLALTRTLTPYRTLEEVVRRNRLNEKHLCALAECGALEGLGLSRRDALWEVRRLLKSANDTLPLPTTDPIPHFDTLSELETIRWDYDSSRHSARGHPLGPLRSVLRTMNLPDAHEVNTMPDGRHIHYAGLVICRQRPGTAKGVVFMTLEDETGFVNLVIWQTVFMKHLVLAKTEPFLGVSGTVQHEEGVVHLIVESMWTPKLETQPVDVSSRDFH